MLVRPGQLRPTLVSRQRLPPTSRFKAYGARGVHVATTLFGVLLRRKQTRAAASAPSALSTRRMDATTASRYLASQ